MINHTAHPSDKSPELQPSAEKSSAHGHGEAADSPSARIPPNANASCSQIAPHAGSQPKDSSNASNDSSLEAALSSNADNPSTAQHGAHEASSAHYAVNVKHYADYSSASRDEMYSDEMRKSLKYASRAAFTRFFIDFGEILFHPSAFWKGQKVHPATLGQLHFPHLAVLIFLRCSAYFTGRILLPGADIADALIQAFTQAVLIFMAVWLFGLIVSALTAVGGGGFQCDRGLRFAGYAMTPTLFIGIISVIPVPFLATICDLLAMPWTFVTIGAGILPFLDIKPERAPIITGLFCGLLVIIWGIMPILIPYLMSLHLW